MSFRKGGNIQCIHGSTLIQFKLLRVTTNVIKTPCNAPAYRSVLHSSVNESTEPAYDLQYYPNSECAALYVRNALPTVRAGLHKLHY